MVCAVGDRLLFHLVPDKDTLMSPHIGAFNTTWRRVNYSGVVSLKTLDKVKRTKEIRKNGAWCFRVASQIGEMSLYWCTATLLCYEVVCIGILFYKCFNYRRHLFRNIRFRYLYNQIVIAATFVKHGFYGPVYIHMLVARMNCHRVAEICWYLIRIVAEGFLLFSPTDMWNAIPNH